MPKRQLGTAGAVRPAQGRCEIERALRSLQAVGLKIRPIHHRLEDRVRARIVLGMLAYSVAGHRRDAWRERLVADEALEAKRERDPLAPAGRSR